MVLHMIIKTVTLTCVDCTTTVTLTNINATPIKLVT